VERAVEQAWVRQAQNGDADAFGQLYQAHVQAIYGYLYSRLRDAHSAEDLTADVFARAYRSLPSYRDQGQAFLAWLYRIAHARLVDHYRRQAVRGTQANLEAQPLPQDEDFDSGLLQAQARSALQRALQALTQEQQTVIRQRFIEGQSLEQTAQAMNKNVNAIKQLQHRAVRALGDQLQRQGWDAQALADLLRGMSQ